MKSILDLLRRPAPTAADLRRALAELPEPASAAATLATLEAQRRARLLDGSADAAIEKIEHAIAAARREGDRIAAAREELTARLTQAEAAERLDALAADQAAAEKEAGAVAALFADRVGKMVAELFGLLARLDAAEVTARAVNQRLEAAAVTDRVGEVEPRLTIAPAVLAGLRRFAHYVEAEKGTRA